MTAGSGVTVAVIVLGGAEQLKRCLGTLMPQVPGLPIEVVVPCDQTVAIPDETRAAFPNVQFLDLGVISTAAPAGTAAAQHELFDKRISAVFDRAKGTHVALLQDWGAPASDWCRAMMAATRLPHAAVGGAVDHAGRGVLNWAVYFLDFGRHQSPLHEGPSRFLSDANVVYRLDDLAGLRHVWGERYNEVLVNWGLLDRGKVLWQRPAMIVSYDRGALALGALLAERLSWGRLFGAARAHSLSVPRLLPYILLSPLIPVVIAGRVAVRVLGGGRNRLAFVQAFPAFVLLTVVWTIGELLGYVTRRPAPGAHPAEARRQP